MKKLVLASVLAFVAVGFFGCSDSLPESITKSAFTKKWQMPKKSSKSKDAKIKVPYLALGVSEIEVRDTDDIKGYVGVAFKEKDSATQIKDIKLYPRKCGVIVRLPKDFDKLNDRQKRIVGSKEQQNSLKLFSNNDEDTAEWNEVEAELKALWYTPKLKGVEFMNCEAKDIDKVELITSDGTFAYEFK